MVREPIVAGRFYPASAKTCGTELDRLFRAASDAEELAGCLFGGLVPHAGWICSGAVTARVLKSLAAKRSPSTVVLFGGAHHYFAGRAAVFGEGEWTTPLGGLTVNEELARRVFRHSELFVVDEDAHLLEHSIEVQTPMIKYLFPCTSILPIMVPSVVDACAMGRYVAEALGDTDAIVLGTTDLTHYGPDYGFAPHGPGAAGISWAAEINDTRFIRLLCAMKAEDLLGEATKSCNACSSGAAAATVAASAALGASEGELLVQTSSSAVLSAQGFGAQENSVGYAGVVFKRA